METRRITLFLTLLLTALMAHATVRTVIDPRVIAQVGANTTAQSLIESRHNERLDSIRSSQGRIAAYTTTMEGIKELYRISMQNISGFGQESQYYGEILSLSLEILQDVPVCLKYVAGNPRNTLLCMNELTNVTLECEGLVRDFVDIVNNGKISNPLKKQEGNQGDGYNFLDRYQRLTLANNIYSRLLEIKYKMDAMVMICQYAGSLGDVLFAIDPESWASYFTATNLVDGIISDWEGLSL